MEIIESCIKMLIVFCVGVGLGAWWVLYSIECPKCGGISAKPRQLCRKCTTEDFVEKKRATREVEPHKNYHR